MTHVFTSESVSEGHPDKVADQISDAILDAYPAQDSNARVACETMVKDNQIIISGEITSTAEVDRESIARQVVKRIGYTDEALGFCWKSSSFQDLISQQSIEIKAGVDRSRAEDRGAGDQGIMFGFACNETPELMPAPIAYAQTIIKRLAKIRNQGGVDWLRPDGKAQVTLGYENDKPESLETLVTSTQHAPGISHKEIEEFVVEEVYKLIFPKKFFSTLKQFYINPAGSFEIGGPASDAGLTGRKIIADTYGGYARHGGGALSGKDPSKVDRSGAYAARQVAKSVVASGLATKCEVQLSYAIGVAEPTSILVETFNTGNISNSEILERVNSQFDLTPWGITNRLDLEKIRYEPIAVYGHFGRLDLDLPWENTIELD